MASGATRRWIAREVGLCWQAMSACGARARQPSPLGEERREQRGVVLRADDAVVRGSSPHSSRKASGSKRVDWSRSEPRVVDAVALLETGGRDGLQVPLLRADDEDVSHSGTRASSAPGMRSPRHRVRRRPLIRGSSSDVVGSLLRPPELLEARRRAAAGELSDAEFKRIEDAPSTRRSASRRRQGSTSSRTARCGGSRSRASCRRPSRASASWDLDAFLWGEWKSDEVGDRTVERPPLAVVGKLRRRRFLSAEEFAYARGPDRPRAQGDAPEPEPVRRASTTPSARATPIRPSTSSSATSPRSSARRSTSSSRLGCDVHPARRAAVPAPARSRLARVLREPRLAGRALAGARARARQPRHRGSSRRHVRLPPLPREPGEPLARRGRLRLAGRAALPARQGRAPAARVRRRALRGVRAARRTCRRRRSPCSGS